MTLSRLPPFTMLRGQLFKENLMRQGPGLSQLPLGLPLMLPVPETQLSQVCYAITL